MMYLRRVRVANQITRDIVRKPISMSTRYKRRNLRKQKWIFLVVTLPYSEALYTNAQDILTSLVIPHILLSTYLSTSNAAIH